MKVILLALLFLLTVAAPTMAVETTVTEHPVSLIPV